MGSRVGFYGSAVALMVGRRLMVTGSRLKAEESRQRLSLGQRRGTGDMASRVEFSGSSVALTVGRRLMVDA
jgi:hypothetical protein